MCTVSVLMPVFNGMPFVKDAVDSILSQSLKDFEFIIIDDGSTDGTINFLHSLTDSRLRIVFNESHVGIGAILKEGVSMSKGEFIARIDADDLALPDRLTKQVEYFRQQPSLGLLGGSYEVFGDVASRTIVKDKDDINLRWSILFKNPFVHSSVMMRRSVLIENNLNYPESLNQDYFLWTDIMKLAQARITPDVVVKHRKHSGALSTTRAKIKMELHMKHVYSLLCDLTGNFLLSESEFPAFYRWMRREENESVSHVKASKFVGVYLSIFKAFVKKHKDRIDKSFFNDEFRRIVRRFPLLMSGGLTCWIVNMKILIEIKLLCQSIK